MSETNEQTTQATEQVVLKLNPEALLFDPEVYGLRDRTTPGYEKYIEHLAQEIKDFGQTQPITVRPSEAAGDYIIIAGQCRVDAVTKLREAGDDGALVKAIVEADIDEDAAYRSAIFENEERRDFTPLERARMYGAIREKFGWKGKTGTKELAAYLRKDQATVAQVEKALLLPDEAKAKLESGEMTLWTALEILNTKPEKRAAVVEKASEIASEEAAKKVAKTGAKVKSKAATGSGMPVAEAETSQDEPKSKKRPEQRTSESDSPQAAQTSKPKITGQHVKAAQKALGVQDKVRAPRMTDLRNWAAEQAGPANPAVVVKFLEKLVQWSSGKVGDKALTAALDDLADKLPATEKAKKAPVKAAVKAPVKVTKTWKEAATKAAAAKHKASPKKKSKVAKKTKSAPNAAKKQVKK